MSGLDSVPMPILVTVCVVYGTVLVVGIALRWAALCAVTLLVQRFADLTLPDRSDFLRQTLTIAAAGTVAAFVPYGWIAGLAVTAVLLRKWFDADTVAVLIVVVLTGAAEWIIALSLIGITAALARLVA